MDSGHLLGKVNGQHVHAYVWQFGEVSEKRFRFHELPKHWQGRESLTLELTWAESTDVKAVYGQLISGGWYPIIQLRGTRLMIICSRHNLRVSELDDQILLDWYSRIIKVGRLQQSQTGNNPATPEQFAEAELKEALRQAQRRADKLRESTSYQLGSQLIQAMSSPSGLLRLPSGLLRIFRAKGGFRTILQKLRKTRTGFGRGNVNEPVEVVNPRRQILVGAILDEFSAACFAPEFRVVNLSGDRWNSQVGSARPDLVFVESAWRAVGGGWQGILSRHGFDTSHRLESLLSWCEERGVPAVFWNKEDPPNYEVFIDAARRFGFIFTTAAEMLDRYRADCPDAALGVLTFAAQPRIHNPISLQTSRLSRVAFAGSWMVAKYPDRGKQLQLLLDPALDLGLLDIFDRNAGKEEGSHQAFPEPYSIAVRGSLSYLEMTKAYRQYAAFLNVNSVDSSPTMLSRRIFEILACRTPVITTGSPAVENTFGDHVLVATDRESARHHIEEMVFDLSSRERRGHLGYRYVHENHTYRHRVDEVLTAIGLDHEPWQPPHVTVICVSNRPERLEHAIDSFRRQSYGSKDLIFVCNSAAFSVEEVSNRVEGLRATVMMIDDSADLGECLNEAIEQASGRFIAKFDDNDDYGRNYLSDMMLTFEYSGAAVAGKASYYAYLENLDQTFLRNPGMEFAYQQFVCGGTIVFDREAVGDLRFPSLHTGIDRAFLRSCAERGFKIFSADRFNFVEHRNRDVNLHTWKIAEDQYLRDCAVVGRGYCSDKVFV